MLQSFELYFYWFFIFLFLRCSCPEPALSQKRLTEFIPFDIHSLYPCELDVVKSFPIQYNFKRIFQIIRLSLRDSIFPRHFLCLRNLVWQFPVTLVALRSHLALQSNNCPTYSTLDILYWTHTLQGRDGQ